MSKIESNSGTHVLLADFHSSSFSQSEVDECVSYKDTFIFIVQVFDAILQSPHSKCIDNSLNEQCKLSNLTEEGNHPNYLNLQVTKLSMTSVSLTQPQLISIMIKDLNFAINTKAKSIWTISTLLLQCATNGDPLTESWDYCSVIGKLNFCETSSGPDIASAVHKCAPLLQIFKNLMPTL